MFAREDRPVPLRLCVIVLMLVATAALALDPSRPPHHYVHRAWSTADGLPQQSVQAIAQSDDGYLWFGTQEGLARFDGVRFEIRDRQNTPALGANNITQLHRTADGALWIATAHGITVYRNGRFNTVPPLEAFGGVFAIAEEADGTLWFGSASHGLVRYQNGVARPFGPADGIQASGVYALAIRDGALWIGTISGLYRRSGEEIQRASEIGIPKEPVYSLAASEGGLWIGTAHGLLHLTSTGAAAAPRELANDEVWALTHDRAGSLWIGTRRGLWRLAGDALAPLGTSEGLSHPFVDSIFEDAQGSLWIGTHLGGLNQLRDGLFVPVTRRDGLTDDTVWSIDGDGSRVWAGTEAGGLDVLQNGTWAALPELRTAALTSVRADGEGGVWVGTAGTGLQHVRGASVQRFDKTTGLPSDTVMALLRDPDGSLWAGTDAGLAHLAGSHLSVYTKKDGLPGDVIVALLRDRRGRLWIATGDGRAAVFDGTAFRDRVDGVALPRDTVISIYEDAAGDIWLPTRRGLYRLHQRTLFLYTTVHGLPSATVSALMEDRRGGIWMASASGVYRVARSELDAVLGGTLARVTVSLYDTRDGMPASEAASGVWPTLWRDAAGRIWLPTAKGIAILDPALHGAPRVPPPLIESIVSDGVLLSPVDALVGQDRRNVEIRYTTPAFASPERIRFRYRLEGYDGQWIDAGSRRTAYYTNLPPGRYRFLIQARDADGPWVAATAGPVLRRPPPFYRTIPFLIGCTALAALLVFALLHWRVRAAEDRHASVLAERSRIAREFHDTLAQGLTGLSLHIETALTMLGDRDRAAEQLQMAKKLARSSTTEVKRALVALRSETLESRALVDAIKDMVETMTEGLPVHGAVRVTGAPRPIGTAGVEEHLLRIAQEAVTNALRHSRAKTIEILLDYEPAVVRLSVRDDGLGSGRFTLDELAASSYGLRGIRERVKEMGGQLSARSHAGRGVEISVEVRE